MNQPTVSGFNAIAPLIIQSYERYLPTAFDESMTVLEKMNKIIQFCNTIGTTTNDVITQWNQVMAWVMSDGITTDISNKLDAMLADGSFNTIINTEILGSKSSILLSNTQPTKEDISTFWMKDFGSTKLQYSDLTPSNSTANPGGITGDTGDNTPVLYGESTDVKPTNLTVVTAYFEMDTENVYLWDNEKKVWRLL
jgi:hypothetical protein